MAKPGATRLREETQSSVPRARAKAPHTLAVTAVPEGTREIGLRGNEKHFPRENAEDDDDGTGWGRATEGTGRGQGGGGRPTRVWDGPANPRGPPATDHASFPTERRRDRRFAGEACRRSGSPRGTSCGGCPHPAGSPAPRKGAALSPPTGGPGAPGWGLRGRASGSETSSCPLAPPHGGGRRCPCRQEGLKGDTRTLGVPTCSRRSGVCVWSLITRGLFMPSPRPPAKPFPRGLLSDGPWPAGSRPRGGDRRVLGPSTPRRTPLQSPRPGATSRGGVCLPTAPQ